MSSTPELSETLQLALPPLFGTQPGHTATAQNGLVPFDLTGPTLIVIGGTFEVGESTLDELNRIN